jgi:hypothetical protein
LPVRRCLSLPFVVALFRWGEDWAVLTLRVISFFLFHASSSVLFSSSSFHSGVNNKITTTKMLLEDAV